MVYWYSLLLAFAISAALIPLVKILANRFGIYAVENSRTVHQGKIARIGGLAILVGFVVSLLVFYRYDNKIWNIVLAAAVVFVEGFVDDVIDVKPIVKLVAQFVFASIMIFGAGVYFDVINLFGYHITSKIFCIAVSYFWYIGMVNAVNLIDGLDGLASGFGIIALFSVGLITAYSNVKLACFALIGGLIGFFIYNYHPGSIFMGDCGAQFLGAMLAALCIMGFKSRTTLAWACPVIINCVPIMDTLLAIIRRAIKHVSFATPDKLHTHHVLMNQMHLGQKGAVLVIHLYTMLLGFNAKLYCLSRYAGLGMFGVLYLILWLFVEKTGMISENWHPILNLIRSIKEKKK
ncbi:MAG: undecaprenyl/decaprenyl-phosphate alpha-N-acetylglucosaminyl 1-phosphate transferase [Erysipelotrichaceae bacterium]|nr:undecaprenyl/decaprenyl-phosphate alpha-N-acetylglucosaminyl 1-phosphate transferase [Erysipelotrichaceae bacterium]